MIRIRPLGSVNSEILYFLKNGLSQVFGAAKILSEIKLPKDCYNSLRDQYNSTCILRRLEPIWITLGVTDVDMYANGLNFVFGEAEVGGTRAVVSTYRLRLNADMELLKIRLLKEAIHEIGHVLGLRHCKDRSCVMCFSNSVFEVDIKSANYCVRCRSKLRGLRF